MQYQSTKILVGFCYWFFVFVTWQIQADACFGSYLDPVIFAQLLLVLV